MPGLLQAQLPEVDITLVPVTSTSYEVRIRPDATFNGLFSSLVFTLRWPDASGVTLTEFLPTDAMVDLGVYPALAGDMVIADGFRYAAHVAFGNSALVNEGQSWVPGQEVVIGTIEQVGGTATMEIVNDTWTGENNSDFFISLNGVDRTGVIYGSNTAQIAVAEEASPIAITASQGGDQAVLRVTAQAPDPAWYEVIACSGSLVDAGRFNIQPGTTEVGIPTNAWAVGLYTINVRTPSTSRTIKIAITE
ncbi:MAG: hypothetical protein ACO1NQ_04650 [Flavobacteriales bacterium]